MALLNHLINNFHLILFGVHQTIITFGQIKQRTMVKKCARHNIGIRRIATDDGGFLLQLLFMIAVISAGIFFQLDFLQWSVVAMVSTAFLFMGFYRSAARLLTIYDDNISLVQGIRIRAMSNLLVVFTAGIAFFSYLMIFMPKINELL
jgi:hypothetical protein